MSPPPHQPPPSHQPPQPNPQNHHSQQPPQHQYYYPYPPPHRPKRSSNTLPSCILATTFLLFLGVAAAITLYILFRPQDPVVSTTSIKFPTFSLLNSSANFTFLQLIAIRNPNRFSFSHYDSSLQLLSSSSGPLGLMYIPAGQISAGRTQFVSATFEVKSVPVAAGSDAGSSVVGPGPTMELETRVKLVGSVKVMKVFAHHVEKSARCRVSVQLSDGSLLGYHC